MAYLDKNGDKNILDELIVTKFEILPPLLNIITRNPNISQSNLRRESKLSGGKIYASVKALKIMKLVENGNGLKITELGKRFLYSYNHDKQEFRLALLNSCLNVPLFNKIYQINKDVKDPNVLFKLFKENLDERYNNVDSKLIGSTIRRYLFGVHDVKLRAGARINSERKIKIDKKVLDKDKKDIIDSIKIFKKSLNLSNNEFQKVIDSLPNEKKEQIMSVVFSQVFK